MGWLVEIRDSDTGLRVRATHSQADDGSRSGVCVVLDGAHLAAHGRGATPDLDIPLPRNRIASTLDVVDERTGRSVLHVPYDLAPYYALDVTALAVANGGVFGRFVARHLDARLWIEFSAGGRRLAAGFATRQGDDEAADYSFALPFLAVVPSNEPAVLTPTIAGKSYPRAGVGVTAADIGVVGFVDESPPGTVVGWAVDLRRPGRRVRLDLVADGAVAASALAGDYRDDLRALGLGDGHSAFTFTLDAKSMALPRTVSVVVADTGVELCNSPTIAVAAPSIRGCLDKLHGMSAHGWALDDDDLDTPVVVEAVCDGEVLATTQAKLFRGDLLDADLRQGFCAFKLTIGPRLLELVGRDVHVRVAGTGIVLQGSPISPTPNANLLRYLRPDRDVPAAVLARLKRAMNHRVGDLSLSIVMPVHDTPREWLVEALASVRRQWCDRWTLICVDDRSTAPHVAEILAGFAARDPRIVVLTLPANVGVAAATNCGLRAAAGDYVAFLDHDDVLEPDAAYHLLRAARQTGAGLIYSDEATTEERVDSIVEVRARPAFSYDYYLSHPYFVHMVCVRRDLAVQVGGWDAGMAISADIDFVLRLLEAADAVAHVPRVLYRWRTHGASTGHARQDAVMDATAGAIQRHLDRRYSGATARPGMAFNQFRIDWPATSGRVLIVIPTHNRADLLRTAVESVERTADGVDYRLVVIDHQSDQLDSRAYLRSLRPRHAVMPYKGRFNYARMNNLAVARYGEDCDFVLFLNNDVEAIEPGWLDRMRRLAHRAEVGAVGALLLYPDRRVQHAGVVLGFNGSADHAFKFEDAYLDDRDRRNLGYNCSLAAVRDFSAVTAACMMMRRAVFSACGGFDEAFGVGFNDTDLCLRIRRAGLKVLYDGASVLFHHESATRSETREILHPEDTARLLDTYGDILADGDPFYNPTLSTVTQDHVLREDRGCKAVRYRVTAPVLPAAPEPLPAEAPVRPGAPAHTRAPAPPPAGPGPAPGRPAGRAARVLRPPGAGLGADMSGR